MPGQCFILIFSQQLIKCRIANFSVAQQIVTGQSTPRSLSGVQTLICMALYANSLSAKTTVHTYLTSAALAAHRMGLHAAEGAYDLPDDERKTRIWTYLALKNLDMYISTSLGLPRVVHTPGLSTSLTDILQIAPSDDLATAKANAELLELFTLASEECYTVSNCSAWKGNYLVPSNRVRRFENELDSWKQRNPLVGTLGGSQTTYTKYVYPPVVRISNLLIC